MQMQMRQRQTRRQELQQLLQQLYWKSVEPTEVALTSLATIWALGLLLNPDLFSLSRSYEAMAGVMPERAWSVFCAVVAAVPLVAFLARSYILRLVSLVLHVALWTFVGVMFVLATPLGLGGPIYLILFSGSASWVAVRLADEHREIVLDAALATTAYLTGRWGALRRGVRWGSRRSPR